MAALISRVGLFLGPVQELHVLGHDLGNPAGAAVLGLIRAGLQASLHGHQPPFAQVVRAHLRKLAPRDDAEKVRLDRKSTRLNSSHVKISYAVFCLKKKKTY